jgi:hypothetical protein
MNERNNKSSRSSNFIVITLLIAIVIYFVASCGYVEEIKLLRGYNERCIQESNDITYSVISGLITSVCKSAEGSLQLAITNAESQLTDTDMDEILYLIDAQERSSIMENEFDSFFQNVYFTYIRNSNNDIFICDRNYIIANYSQKKDKDVYAYIPWDEVSSQPNAPDLSGDALAELLDEEDPQPVTYKNDGSGKSYTIDEVEELYLSEGIEAFKNINILVPVYITTDLRGHYSMDYMDDYPESESIKYRAIIVQEFNIYDQLIAMEPEIEDSYSVGFSDEELSGIIIALYLSGFCLLIGIVLFISIIIWIFNNSYQKND